MPDTSPSAEKPPVSKEGQSPGVSPVVSPGAAAEKRRNFIYKIFHWKQKEVIKPAGTGPISTETPALAKRIEPAPAKLLTPAQIKRAELEKSIAEAGEKEGLKVALEGRLEGWHTKISDWLIRTQDVPDPISVRESLSRFGQLVMDPELRVEDSKRQGAEMARDVLRVAEKLVTSIRLRLGGPYSKGGQNGSDN